MRSENRNFFCDSYIHFACCIDSFVRHKGNILANLAIYFSRKGTYALERVGVWGHNCKVLRLSVVMRCRLFSFFLGRNFKKFLAQNYDCQWQKWVIPSLYINLSSFHRFDFRRGGELFGSRVWGNSPICSLCIQSRKEKKYLWKQRIIYSSCLSLCFSFNFDSCGWDEGNQLIFIRTFSLNFETNVPPNRRSLGIHETHPSDDHVCMTIYICENSARNERDEKVRDWLPKPGGKFPFRKLQISLNSV